MKKHDKWIGYCTNVHAGFNLDVTRKNLEEHAVAVKQMTAPDQPMGIGLWLSDQTASELLDAGRLDDFRQWLEQRELVPFTFNGFPFGNFHQDEVKKLVYLPTWAEDSRREYSQNLATIQNALLPAGMEGSISTLPIAWDDDLVEPEFLEQSADQLIRLATFLEELEERDNRLIYFCLEPEPGCLLQTSQTCVEFFQNHLLGRSPGIDSVVQRYLRICHDVCHSAVMFEDQNEFVHNIQSAGIRIGKVQVSSAVFADFDPGDAELSRSVLEQLSQFKEPRYLHQTVLQAADGTTTFYEDLAPALKELHANLENYRQARVHFHVPIYLKRFGNLRTSQTEIYQCLDATQNLDGMIHYEAETYAWNVLPEELQHSTLAAGIAEEIKWLADL